MTLAKPTFPAPDHDHGRCTADAMTHAEQVCARRAQKFTPIRRHVLQALLSSHRPLGAYEVIDELAKSMPRPAPITVYRALDFLMENGLVHRIESRDAFLACLQIYRAQAASTGKPANVVEKIVEGKMSKFYEEVCLLDQPFIKDQAISVGQLIASTIGKLGENISVRRFARFKVGDAGETIAVTKPAAEPQEK